MAGIPAPPRHRRPSLLWAERPPVLVKAASLITPEVSSYSVHYVAVNDARGRYSAAQLDRAAYVVGVGLGLFPGCEVAASLITPEVSSYSVHYVAVNDARGRYSAAQLDRHVVN